MPSPFPGMNPYLEQDGAWRSFHESYFHLVTEQLVPQVRPNYIVLTDESVYVHDPSSDSPQWFNRPDVVVSNYRRGVPSGLASAVLVAPEQAVIPGVAEERLSLIRVLDRFSRRVITVIELLSPSNKTGSGRDQYLAKRNAYLESDAHLVEIDLLRGGPRMPPIGRMPCDYRVLISRVEDRPRADLWPIKLRERLPIIPIPLRAPTPDAKLDLQVVLERIYEVGSYADYIYDRPPKPPLNDADAAWAEGLLKAQQHGDINA